MLREIGSDFWIKPDEKNDKNCNITPETFHIQGSDYVWLSSGRAAISFVLESLKREKKLLKATALIPSYTCHTVIEPFLQAGYEVKSIPIDDRLCTNSEQLLYTAEKLQADIVLFHRYFGFNTIFNCDAAIRELKKAGVVTIEDRTQSLYSEFSPSPSDYIVASIRKWHGVPDGGFAVCREGNFENKPIEYDERLEREKIQAGILKYEYIFHHKGEKAMFLSKYKAAENILSNQKKAYAISDISLQMQINLNVKKMIHQRRKNYLYLLRALIKQKEIKPLFPELPENVTPLYFPIVVNKREKIQGYLSENHIYAPIIWPKAKAITVDSIEANRLYDQLLCLPIDQRYNVDDMRRIAECIYKYDSSN